MLTEEMRRCLGVYTGVMKRHLTLTDPERAALTHTMRTSRDARIVRRAQALLWLDHGETITAVATRLQVSRQTISERIRTLAWAWKAVIAATGGGFPQRMDDPFG